MKRLLSTLLVLAIIVSSLACLSSCKEKEIPSRARVVSYVYFNTQSSIAAYGDSDVERLDTYVEAAAELLGYYHKLFDIYFEYSGMNNLRTVNLKAGKEPVKVDSELIDFLLYCKELFTLTDGRTNVMMGAVLKIWHNHREDGQSDPKTATLPEMAELQAAAEHTDIDLLVIDRDAGTVYISDPEASIDVGAIGKGYATERLYEKVCALGAGSLVLNIGGNIRTTGLMPDGSVWKVGITNPDRTATDFATTVTIGRTSCVTSGDYERGYLVDGVNYHHIIDPDTLMPATYFSSITVITPDSALADALSTALFCLDYDEGVALIEKADAEIEVIWIDKNGKITKTDGLK